MTLARAAAKHAANTIQGFNLGLARFDSHNNGGFIDLPIGPIATNKTMTKLIPILLTEARR